MKKELLILSILALVLAGCVTKSSYNLVQANLTNVTAERDALKAELQKSNAQLQAVKNALVRFDYYKTYINEELKPGLDEPTKAQFDAAGKISPALKANLTAAVAAVKELVKYGETNTPPSESENERCKREPECTFYAGAMVSAYGGFTGFARMEGAFKQSLLEDLTKAIDASKTAGPASNKETVEKAETAPVQTPKKEDNSDAWIAVLVIAGLGIAGFGFVAVSVVVVIWLLRKMGMMEPRKKK